jgi:hypothetical protein
MAKMLRRRYQLIVLAVRLVTVGRDGDSVELALERANGDDGPFSKWSLPLDAGQLTENLLKVRGDDSGRKVHEFFSRVAAEIDQVLDSIGHEGPLWIHLVKPYGLLGGVAWEKLLKKSSHPLLRLPDALASKPLATPNKLNVVLCAGLAKCPAKDAPVLTEIVAQSILQLLPKRDVHIWVFANTGDQADFNQLTSLASRVHVVDPMAWPGSLMSTSSLASTSGATGPVHPWLEWMEWTMSAIEVDVVHFLCDGYLASEGGQLAFSGTPHNREAPSPFVGAAELSQFMLRIGAWSLAFTAPPLNPSALGLRVLCDRFAQTRPGPVMYHALKDDFDARQLEDAYAFLYLSDYTVIQTMPAIALCCQPELVAACARRARAAELFPPGPPIASVGKGADAPPDFGSSFQKKPGIVTTLTTRRSRDEQSDEFESLTPIVPAIPGYNPEIGYGGIDEQSHDNSKLPAFSTPSLQPEPNQMQAVIPAWLGPGQRFVEAKLFEMQLEENARSAFSTQETPEKAGMESGLNDIQAALRSLSVKGIL